MSDEAGDVSFESQKILDFNYDVVGIKDKHNTYHNEVKIQLQGFLQENKENKPGKVLKGRNILAIEVAIWVKG